MTVSSQLAVGVRELRGNLTHYLREAREGRSVLITSHDTVIAELRAPSPEFLPVREAGALRGQIQMADDFDSLPEDILDAIEA